MSNVDPKLVRQEIDELLTSGRLERLETVSAHIFQMFGREWRELTSSEVFIHVFHDSFDDVDKLLARDRYKLVFDFIPLSASFTFTCLSRKFVRLSLNKFERTAPAYGFGFSNLREMETFCAHLDRIRSYAKATLVPPVRSIVLGMGNIGLQSPSSTPPRVNIPYFYADNTVTDIPSTLTALNHSSLLCRDPPQFHQYCSRAPFHSRHNNSMSASDFISRHDLPCNDCISDEYGCAEPTTIIPMCEAPDLSKVDLKQNLRKRSSENDGQPMSRVSFVAL